MKNVETPSRPRILAVARDPGAASALVPVIRTGPATVVAMKHARGVFERAGLPFVDAADEDDGVADALIAAHAPDVLLTGTSLRVERDRRWWQAAAARGIPAVALLDHWIAYAERFTVGQPFDALPDIVAVMDDVARRHMIDAGCPPDRIAVTGQPAFDEIIAGDVPSRADGRRAWGAADADWVVLFVSEPQEVDHGPDLGYTEAQALAMAADALRGLDARLIVRPHPRESREKLAAVLNGERPFVFDVNPNRLASVAAADTVVGMTSILLLESALAGRPVLSIQPGRVARWTGEFPELMNVVRTQADVNRWLGDAGNRRPFDGAARRARAEASGLPRDAAAGIWTLLGEVASHDRG